MVRLLLKAKVPKVAEADQAPALTVAAVRGHAEVVQLLLKHGPGVDEDDWDYPLWLLSQVARAGHADVAQVLLDGGFCMHEADSDGRTALMEAAYEGREAAVRVLLSHSPEPVLQAVDEEGRTALFEACQAHGGVGAARAGCRLLLAGAKDDVALEGAPCYQGGMYGSQHQWSVRSVSQPATTRDSSSPCPCM